VFRSDTSFAPRKGKTKAAEQSTAALQRETKAKNQSGEGLAALQTRNQGGAARCTGNEDVQDETEAAMRRFLAIVGVLLILACLPGMLSAAPRNVVLFVTDDQGQDAGCYGNKVLKTPNLDRLAAEGTLFKYAFCTTASCSASRSVILSGLHNHANGQ